MQGEEPNYLTINSDKAMDCIWKGTLVNAAHYTFITRAREINTLHSPERASIGGGLSVYPNSQSKLSGNRDLAPYLKEWNLNSATYSSLMK